MIITIIILSILIALMMLIADDMILTKYEYKSWYKKLYFISEFIVILCKFIIIVLSLGLVCFFIDKIFDHD